MKWAKRLFFVNRHSLVIFLAFLFVSLHVRGYTWTDLPAKLSAVITDNWMTVDTIEALSSITLRVPVGTHMAHIYVQRDTSINWGEDYEYMHGYCGYGYPWTFCRDKCCTHGLEGLDVDGCVEDHSSYAWSVLENGELEYLYGGMLTLESTMVESRETEHRLLPGEHPFTMGFFHTWCIHSVGNFESYDLQNFEYNDKHYSHSRQFLSNFYAEKPYWSQVLENCNPNQQQ